jgi:hypothetical protein
MGKMVTTNQSLLFFKIESLTYVGRHPLGRQEVRTLQFFIFTNLSFPQQYYTSILYFVLLETENSPFLSFEFSYSFSINENTNLFDSHFCHRRHISPVRNQEQQPPIIAKGRLYFEK